MRTSIILLIAILISGLFPARFGAAETQQCNSPVCLSNYDQLNLAEIINFESVASSAGPGRSLDHVLDGDGAKFGERFAGQFQSSTSEHDLIAGVALAPLTPVAGRENQSLGVQRMFNNNILLGYGPVGFPRRQAIGEGAIAVVFDVDQSAFGFRMLGGEEGLASITFFRRDGMVIGTLDLGPLAENTFGFRRNGDISDIAGFVIVNQDPEGIAIDDLIFGGIARLSGVLGTTQIPVL